MNSLYWTIREKVRKSWLIQATLGNLIYIAQILLNSNRGEFRNKVIRATRDSKAGQGVALCVRIRDEALNLREFVEYYLAAGISHIYFYEALSKDDFQSVLDPFIAQGTVTVMANWPHVPVSPAAEHDCILRSIGRYAWVGFVDADEFVVVKGNLRIDDTLKIIPSRYPALALHGIQFGSSGYLTRPDKPVIAAYQLREENPNRHVKVFVRPERVASQRNSHCWYYRGFFNVAVNENMRRILGSISLRPTARKAWINHYHHKSQAEYLAKAAEVSVLDAVGMKFNNRTAERSQIYEQAANAVSDRSALDYHLALCHRPGCSICASQL